MRGNRGTTRYEANPWTPVAGMTITKYTPSPGASNTAKILRVLDDGSLRVQHLEHSKRTTTLADITWKGDWRPVDAQSAQTKLDIHNIHISASLTEADVRRIVREELGAMFAAARSG